MSDERHDEQRRLDDMAGCTAKAWNETSEGQRARELIERADRGEGRADIKLVADYLRRKPTTIEAQPGPPPRLSEDRRAALAGLFAGEGRTLLQLLFAWRAQGSLTRWSTGPSKALALFVDFLLREWPSGCAAAGTDDLDFQKAPGCENADVANPDAGLR